MADLIDRQEVLDWLNDEWDGMVLSVFDGIRALPSAQPEKMQLSREDATFDCISRQAAIDAIRKDMYADKDYMSAMICDGIEDVLNGLPTAQPEPQWIPCSERFPEEWGDYLVTKKEIGWNYEEYQVNDIAYYDRDSFHKANTVLAWMPLPEPYKGES